MFLLHFLGLLSFLPVTSAPTVVLGQTATITCNRSCSTVEWFTEKIPVCSFSKENVTVTPEIKDRIKFSEANPWQGNASLIITNTVYNDRNWYVCSCDGEKCCDRYLDILVPTSLNIIVGDEAKVPCYAETNKRTAQSNAYVRWKKDDRLVVELAHGQMEFGAGFEGRVSVSKEDYNKGDLSLTIHDVRASDAGLYRCFAQNEKSIRPEVIHLIVKGSPLSWSPAHYFSVVCVIILLVFVGVLLCFNRQKLFTLLHNL